MDNDIALALSVTQPDHFEVATQTITKPIRQTEVVKSLNKSLMTYAKDGLSPIRLPDKLVERVTRVLLIALTQEKAGQDDLELDFGNPTATSEKVQNFIESCYDQLLPHFRADSSHIFTDKLRKRDSEGSLRSLSEQERRDRKGKQRREREELAEKEASEATEAIEALVCRSLFNRFGLNLRVIRHWPDAQTILSVGVG